MQEKKATHHCIRRNRTLIPTLKSQRSTSYIQFYEGNELLLKTKVGVVVCKEVWKRYSYTIYDLKVLSAMHSYSLKQMWEMSNFWYPAHKWSVMYKWKKSQKKSNKRSSSPFSLRDRHVVLLHRMIHSITRALNSLDAVVLMC